MKKLTLRQQKFVRFYLESEGNGRLAAERAGYAPSVARIKASQNLDKPHIQQAIREQLEEAGITPEFVDNSLKEIIEAGVQNKGNARPSDAVSAIRMVNELSNRFPPQRKLQANLELSQRQLELESKSEDELIEELERVHRDTEKLLRDVKEARADQKKRQMQAIEGL